MLTIIFCIVFCGLRQADWQQNKLKGVGSQAH